jgi:hypothetical protein
MDATVPELPEQAVNGTTAIPRRRARLVRRVGIVSLIAALCAAYLLQDHIRTLRSLRHIPGTNAYVMDYYVDYHIDQIRAHGMDVNNIEDGLIRVFFPDLLAPIASGSKGRFIDEKVETLPPGAHRCSTVALRNGGGDVFFGRNFDWKHDACLIVKIHGRGSLSSVAVIDLHYLNLDRDDLETTSLLERIPLLFAPYYLQDGMNEYGVAVADMSVDGVAAPHDPAKPDLLHSTAMRLILDYAKTTDEAIDLLKQYNIHFAETTCHMMIADTAGKSAVVEFIEGDIKTTPPESFWQVCTNHQISGRTEEESDQCCQRYQSASHQLAALPSVATSAEVMNVMESIAQPDWTMWTSVYNLSTRELQLAYRQRFSEPYRVYVRLAD